MDANFCIEALEEALKRGQPDIFNTDQGSQFTSRKPSSKLLQATWGVLMSMDGKGRYRYKNNIFVEGLWRTVKYEEVYLKAIPGWTGRQEWTQGVLPILQQPTTPPGPG